MKKPRPKRTREPLKVLPPPTLAMTAFMKTAAPAALAPEDNPEATARAPVLPSPELEEPTPEAGAPPPVSSAPARSRRMRGLVARADGDLYKLPVLIDPELAAWFKRFCQENEVHMSALAVAAVEPLIHQLRALEAPTPEAVRAAFAQVDRFPAAVAAAVCAVIGAPQAGA